MLKRNTLGSRFILLFCAITIPLLLILFAVGNYAKGVVLSQVANSYQNLVDSNLSMIDKSLEDIEKNMLDIVNHDDNFQQFGQPGLTDSEKYFTQIELIQRNTTYQTYYHNVDMFFIYSKPNDQLNSTDMFGAASSYKEEVRQWLADSFHQPKTIKSLMYKWSIVRIEDQYFLVRLVSDDLENNAYIGAIINVNSLITPLGNLDLQEGSDVVIAGKDGKVLSGVSEPLEDIKALPAEKLGINQSFSLSEGRSKLLVVASRSEKTGLNMAVILPNSQLLKGLSAFQTVINLLPLLAVVILLFYILIFRSIIFKPIAQLLGAIRRIKEGQMHTRLPDSGIMEFAIINHSFNQMVEEIVNLKIDVYEGRLRSQKAEMKQLQLQINPHFFLNTLNIAFQLADLGRTELVKKTVRHLMQYFRFMLHSKREFNTLNQEMEHVRNYLEIQKLRYQEAFEFEIRIADDLRDVEIPSLLIQPFVENAMVHGMSIKAPPFILEIEARRMEGAEELMLVEIRDNGKGIPPEKIEELNSDEYAPDSEDSHIGIWNVKKRLAVHYREKAQLRFQQQEPRGARVRIIVPVESYEEQMKHA
ncbi:sensor histidine kinase [Cohnella candidum]|uniref:HAMP domain-containing protein n=1 Tax=Cohnella candidum TaxID=2674991 RepID=A0A3G3K507_9BACL|nr:histidine kinase [Cohnella candidum]AYQ74829.1 HAMP domain-containing protein [Cohnella candidum]